MQTNSENTSQLFNKTSSIQLNQNDTQILKQKMKQLQLEIQNLQKLKRQNKTGSKMSNYSKNSQIKKQDKLLPETHRTNDQQQYDQQIQQKNYQPNYQPQNLKDFSQNFKNNKITNLMSQLSSKDQLQKNKKRLLSTSLNNRTNKQTLNDLRQKLQKTNNSQNPKKNVKINIMELKGVVHQVDSNIFNVTVAQIMTEEHEKYEMIKQIKELREKLKSLEQKKRQSSEKKRIMSNLEPSFGEISMFRSQNEGAGKIFNSSKMTNLRKTNNDFSHRSNNFQDNNFIQQQRKSIQLKKSANPLAWNPQINLTTKKPISQNRINRNSRNGRFYSTINIESHNLNDSFEKKQQSSKKPLFKILKKKFTNQSTKQQIQKPVQQKIPIQPLQLLPQMKIQNFKFQTNNKIPQNFILNFREYIKQKILQFALPPQPHPYDTQADLQSLGIILFSLFDIYVQEQTKSNKGVEYKVTKYKNCVLFRLNDQKNVVWYYDGKFYFGGWDISLIGEGKKEGFGIQIVPATYTYQGFFVNNKRQGYGIMINSFRSDTNRNIIYEGNWKEGFKNGKGYQIQEDLEYLGDFLQGLQTGKCKIRTKSTFYQGDIKESIKQGNGYQILKNGDQYYGEFKKNMFHGLGQYKWKSGAYFYGQFFEGLRKGYGIWISKLDSDLFDSYKGQYNQNKKNGYGIYQWANGTIYQGYFKNDLRHDQGLMKYPNGKAGKFIWKDGNKAYKIYCQEQQIYRKKGGLQQSKSKIKINQQDSQNLQKQQMNTLQNIPRPALQQLQEKSSSLFLYKPSLKQHDQ